MSQFSDNYLLIDIGNSNIKWITEGKNYTSLIDDFSIDMLPNAEKIWVSCVANCEILDGLKNINFAKTDYQFDSLKCGYKDPSELGVDRYLAIIAAMNCYRNQDLLVIDIGSAITFDVLDKNGLHQGGLIMPGISALRGSFEKFKTSDLSLGLNSLASNTDDAWRFGTHAMMVSAINYQIESFQSNFSNGVVSVCGGMAKEIKKELPESIEFFDNLVLDGLESYSQSVG